jgi:Ion channel
VLLIVPFYLIDYRWIATKLVILFYTNEILEFYSSIMTDIVGYGLSWTPLLQFIIGVQNYLLYYCFLTHYFTCWWIMVASTSADGWYAAYVKPDDSYSRIYLKGFYFVVVTFATVGYGDYLPLNVSEYIFANVLQNIGIFLYANVIGNVRHFARKVNAVSEMTTQRKEDIENWCMSV